MTREERIKHIEELEIKLTLLEKEEIAKHNIYYDKKMQLHREKEKEKMAMLRVDIRRLIEELVNIIQRKVGIRQELQQLNNEHKYLQYAKN